MTLKYPTYYDETIKTPSVENNYGYLLVTPISVDDMKKIEEVSKKYKNFKSVEDISTKNILKKYKKEYRNIMKKRSKKRSKKRKKISRKTKRYLKSIPRPNRYRNVQYGGIKPLNPDINTIFNEINYFLDNTKYCIIIIKAAQHYNPILTISGLLGLDVKIFDRNGTQFGSVKNYVPVA